MLVCAPLASLGGAVSHLRRVLPRLAASPEVAWSFLGPPELRAALGPALEGFEVFEADCTRYRDRLHTELVVAPEVARAVRADVVYGPLGLYSPPLMDRLVWIPHNVAPYSERYLRLVGPGQVARLTALRWTHVLAARHGRRTTCISKHGRLCLARAAELPQSAFPVIYHGAELSEPPPPPARLALRHALGLDAPFLLSVAHGYRYKNLVELVRAFDLIRARTKRSPLVLALAGAWPDAGYEAEVRREIERRHLGQHVRFLGAVGAAELVALEVEAEVVVATSWLENCPTSLLEQLHLGCAIVCSSLPSMPEHVGDAAWTVDVDDPDDIAAGVIRLLDDLRLRAELRDKARARAARFRWDECAERTLAVLLEAARDR